MKNVFSKNKLVVALAVMGMGLTSAHAVNTIDPAYNVQVLGGDNNTVGGAVPASMSNSTSLTTIAGFQNTMTSSNSSQIYGNFNTQTNADAPILGEGNEITGVYGVIVGDVNNITTTSAPTATTDDRKGVFVYGNGNQGTGIESATIVGSKNTVTNTTNAIVLGSGTTVTANNSVTLGDNSTNTRDNTVSVGSAGVVERQITNVAQGTETTDAVNVGQLNTSIVNAVSTAGQQAKVYADTQNQLQDQAHATDVANLQNNINTVDTENKAHDALQDNSLSVLTQNDQTRADQFASLDAQSNTQAQQIADLNTATTNLNGAVTNLADTDTNLQDQINANNARDDGQDQQIATLGTQANQNTADIATANNTLTDLQGVVAQKADQGSLDTTNAQVAQNTADIATKANQADVASLQDNITAIDTKADANTQAIADTNSQLAQKADTTYVDTANQAQDAVIAQNKAVADTQNTNTNLRIGSVENRVTTVEATVQKQGALFDGLLSANTDTATTGTTTIGLGATNNGTTGSTLLGNNATTMGNNATIIGNGANGAGENTVAIGKNATVVGDNTTALGANTKVTAPNAVAIGAGSIADTANTVSVGSAGNERIITNVANGINATDAVNVNQLNQASKAFGYKVDKLDKDLSGGIAGAVALASMPNAQVGHHAISFGTGVYNSESAMSIGYSTSFATKTNHVVSVKVGGAFAGGGNSSVGAGLTYNFN